MKKIIHTSIFMLLAIHFCFAQGFWSKVGDMPEIRYGHSVNELNGKIYVVGGINTETSVFPKTALVYDNSLKEWSSIPLARNKIRDMHGSCVIDGKLYVMGGNDSLHTVATMDMFDPETGEWTSKSPMSIDRGLPACAAIDDKIYVMGGIQVLGNILNLSAGYYKWEGLNSVEVYDTKNDTWTTLADMPRRRWGPSAAACNGKIYVFGGTAGMAATVYNIVDIYDPQTNTWTTGDTFMPTARYCLTTCVLDNNIYAIGGWANSGAGPIYDKVEVYNPQTNEWKLKIRFRLQGLERSLLLLMAKFLFMEVPGQLTQILVLQRFMNSPMMIFLRSSHLLVNITQLKIRILCCLQPDSLILKTTHLHHILPVQIRKVFK